MSSKYIHIDRPTSFSGLEGAIVIEGWYATDNREEATVVKLDGREVKYYEIDRQDVASIFAEIETFFSIKIPVYTLVDAPTIEQLAPIVDRLREQAGS